MSLAVVLLLNFCCVTHFGVGNAAVQKLRSPKKYDVQNRYGITAAGIYIMQKLLIIFLTFKRKFWHPVWHSVPD